MLYLAAFGSVVVAACATVVVQTGREGRVHIDQDAPSRDIEIGTTKEKDQEKAKGDSGETR